MTKDVHILNGDALLEHFPQTISGTKLVMRECLVDGPVIGSTLTDFYNTRAVFLAKHYPPTTPADYTEKSVSEFERMLEIPLGAAVHLWFEDDLFCQVNLWFVVHLLWSSNKRFKIYLIRPQDQLRFGFGGLTESELVTAYEHRKAITSPELFSNLWPAYQSGDLETLVELGTQLSGEMPFVLAAIQAHMDRLPSADSEGLPIETLKAILTRHDADDFGTVFRAFSDALPIYGFGDAQVKRLLNEMQNTH